MEFHYLLKHTFLPIFKQSIYFFLISIWKKNMKTNLALLTLYFCTLIWSQFVISFFFFKFSLRISITLFLFMCIINSSIFLCFSLFIGQQSIFTFGQTSRLWMKVTTILFYSGTAAVTMKITLVQYADREIQFTYSI